MNKTINHLGCWICAGFLLSACVAPEAENFKSLYLSQPKVLQVTPNENSELASPFQITLEFSQRIDMGSLSRSSVFLIGAELIEPYLDDFSEVLEDLKDNKLELMPLHLELAGDERLLTIQPETEPPAGIYFLVVTPLLKSVTGIPFNQEPGSNPSPFLARFGFGTSIRDSWETGFVAAPKAPPPNFLVLNEILYDGRDSENDGEAFIELFGTPLADLSDFHIELVNGSNGEITDRIYLEPGARLSEAGLYVIADLRTSSTDTSRVPLYDQLDQFDPQNGPDALMLRDQTGKVWDALWYGEGAVEFTVDGIPMGEGEPAPDAPAGQSLSRDLGADTENNFEDFRILENPTPGLP